MQSSQSQSSGAQSSTNSSNSTSNQSSTSQSYSGSYGSKYDPIGEGIKNYPDIKDDLYPNGEEGDDADD